jgi:hypothetical protein
MVKNPISIFFPFVSLTLAYFSFPFSIQHRKIKMK